MWSATSRIRMEIPMVMMIIRSTEGWYSHRINKISMSAPMTIVMSTAARMAAGRGRNRLRVTAVIPPSMTNSPWAKLMIPVVL
jgi:hypothetical protein